MDLFPDQQHALDLAARSRLFILTGAAGTGKSTAVRAILDALSVPTERYFLAAPSGKAAKRLSEVSGRPAVTIHRLLKPIREGKHFVFTRGPDNRIPADLIVLDEVSMVDVSLMARFLEAVAPGTRLIFVGDPYQLPSVGPGNVLRDFLASGVIPAAELTIIKRQDEGLLIRNCHRIKSGEDIHVDNAKTGDFYFLEQDTEEAIQAKIVELTTKSLPASRGFDPMHDIQVISPFRERTTLSCKAINEKLQQALNTNPALDNCRFRLGDKVIQQKNDYENDIVNGDIGYVERIEQALRRIEVRFENPDRLVKLDLFQNHLELAYCLTIHKSQGSEWPAVIIPIHSTFGSLMLHRNLLYTAVSRAKKLCVIVGQREEIPKIVARAGQENRYTGLAGLLSRRDETP
ncbi:MAG: hypothetical protein A2992_06445 [Elusimicrobia bacterium RIFCSPLOWO2_01_FULL_59_12]|nr:MAG: hypothetical protein A2992_06445 [Elusimicrobia bacterium RIFCSPLOWO2_01_FULL_59_12]